MKSFFEQIDESLLESLMLEKLIKINKGKKNGQVVIMAGGSGSGKGFAIANFLDANSYKVLDVDEIKRLLIKISQQKGKFPELKNLNLRTPGDVARLHQFVKEHGLSTKRENLIFQNILGKEPDRRPNILFDVTLKEKEDLFDILQPMQELGYEPTDFHVVWALADYRIAVKRNNSRSRVVPEDIVLKTHEGVANTMYSFISGFLPRQLLDGEIYVLLTNPKNTIFYQHPQTKELLDGGVVRDKNGDIVYDSDGNPKRRKLVIKDFKYIKLKDKGRPIYPESEVYKELYQWIIDNIPKSTNLRHIFPSGVELEEDNPNG